MSDALTAAPERVRLIVFDWDGTLIDSIGTIVGCTRAMLEELGLPAVAEEAIRSMIGSGLEESIRSFAPGYDERDFDRVINTYRRLWVEEYHARSELFAGAGEVVRGLHAAGYLLAVATAKGRRGLGLDLARCGLAGYFHTTRTVDEAPSKPNPGMLLDILEEMGVRAEEALMVGDSVHDLRMGHNAGVAPIAVTSGAVSGDRLLEETPLACLASVLDLPAWLGSGYDPPHVGHRASGSRHHT
jgi:phosphoglycolate phosphatase